MHCSKCMLRSIMLEANIYFIFCLNQILLYKINTWKTSLDTVPFIDRLGFEERIVVIDTDVGFMVTLISMKLRNEMLNR